MLILQYNTLWENAFKQVDIRGLSTIESTTLPVESAYTY